MKSFIVASFFLLVGVAGHALGQVGCPGGTTRLVDNDVTNLVSGNTMCATRGTERWQEYHQAGGHSSTGSSAPVILSTRENK